MCMSLHSLLCSCLKTQKCNMVKQYMCMTSQIAWYNSEWGGAQRKEHLCTECLCLCETMCAHTFCMWLHCLDMLSCPDLRMKTASSLSWGGSSTSFFLTWNTCSVALEGGTHKKTSESCTSRHLSSFCTSHSFHWMFTSTLYTLLPRTRDRIV